MTLQECHTMTAHKKATMKEGLLKKRLVPIALLPPILLSLISCQSRNAPTESPSQTSAFGLNFQLVPKKELTVDGRTATVFFKRQPFSQKKRALLLFLHGFGNEPIPLAQLLGMPRALDKFSFVLLIPRATNGKNAEGEDVLAWNATDRCCGFGTPENPLSDRQKPDDEGYLVQLVRQALSDTALNIDPQQIYIFGYSNGGFMAHTLACNHSNLFHGIISYAGTSHEDAGKCRPADAVNVLQIHGTADEIIRYDNPSIRPAQQSPTDRPWFPPPRDVVKRWATLNQCSEESVVLREDFISLAIQPNPTLAEGARVTVGQVAGRGEPDTRVEIFANCRRGRVGFWSIEGGSHFNIFNPGTFDKAWEFVSRTNAD